jgi:hypothetical protein
MTFDASGTFDTSGLYVWTNRYRFDTEDWETFGTTSYGRNTLTLPKTSFTGARLLPTTHVVSVQSIRRTFNPNEDSNTIGVTYRVTDEKPTDSPVTEDKTLGLVIGLIVAVVVAVAIAIVGTLIWCSMKKRLDRALEPDGQQPITQDGLVGSQESTGADCRYPDPGA